MLEDRGWLIHRIWSTDWFQRPDEQLRKVLEAVEQAKVLQVRRRDRTREHPPRTNRSRAPQPRPSVSRESSAGEESGSDGNPLSQPYVIAAFGVPTHRAIHDTRDAELARIVARIVDIEGPIHEQELARLLGFPTTTARLARIIQRERDRLLESGRLVQRGDKLSPAEHGLAD